MNGLLARLGQWVSGIGTGWLVLLASVVVLLLLYIVVVVLRARYEAQGTLHSDEDESGGGLADLMSLGPRAIAIRDAFARERRAHRRIVPWSAARAETSTFLLLGRPGSGKTSLVNGIGLMNRFDETVNPASNPVRWALFDGGAVIDPDGQIVGEAEAEDPTTWRQLLAAIRRRRPSRPLDGIVVTLPVTRLVGTTAAAEAEAEGRRLAHRLKAINRELGVSTPIYVVLTKCDELDGFSETVGRLPESRREEAFGWSSPYHVDTSFRSEWITVAMRRIEDALLEIQLELMNDAPGDGVSLTDQEAVFLLGERIEQLGETLGVFLTALLPDPATSRTGPFRGIYLTGAASDEPGEEATLKKPLFVTDLFEQKIFAEASLARAISGFVVQRQQRSRYLRFSVVGVLLLGAFLAFRWSGLTRDVDHALFPFALLASDVQLDAGFGPEVFRPDQVESVLRVLSSIEADKMWSWLVPASWPWYSRSLRRRGDHAIETAFEHRILDAARGGLIQCSTALVRDGREGSTLPCVVAMSELHPVLRLEAQLSGMDSLAANVGRYNFLAVPGQYRAADLHGLVSYLVGAGIAEVTVDRDDRVFERAVDEIDGVPLAPSHFPGLSRAFAMASRRSLEEAYDLVRSQAIDLAAKIDSLPFAAVNRSPDLIPRIVALADSVEMFLEAGIQTDSISSPGWGIVLDSDSARSVARALNEVWRAKASQFDEEVATIATATGPLIESNRLAPAIVALLALLRDLDQTPAFARSPGRSAADRIERGEGYFPGTRRELRSALDAIAEFDRFAELLGSDEGAPQPVDPALSAYVLAAARSRVAASMTRLPHPAGHRAAVAEGLRTNVRSLEAAWEDVEPLLEGLRRVAPYDTAVYLATARSLVRTADGWLGVADSLLFVHQRTFSVDYGSILAWDGSSGLARRATRMPVDAFVEAHEAEARATYQAYAQPLLGILASPALQYYRDLSPDSSTARARWLATEQALGEDEGPLQRLSAFVSDSIDALSTERCEESLTRSRAGVFGEDFFDRRLFQTLEDLAFVCRQLVFDANASAYASLSAYFDSVGVGVFPFAPDSVSEVERDQLVHLGSLRRGVVGRLESSRWIRESMPPSEDVSRFLGALEPLDGLVRALATGDSLLLDIQFRSPEDGGAGRRNVAEWFVELPNRVASTDPDGDRHLVPWSVGESVTVGFRWAGNSTEVPWPDEQADNLVVSRARRTARFAFGGTWSAIRMLSDASRHRADSVHTLQFGVGSGPWPGPEPEKLPLLMQVVLRDPETLAPVSWPVWPGPAPSTWSSDGVEGR